MWRNVLFGVNVGYRARFGRRGKRRLAAAGALAAITAAALAGAPAAAAGPGETVIVTASGSLSPVTAVLQVGGTVQTRFHLINGVVASIPTGEEGVLAALPGISVTPDAQVSLQGVPESTGPHAPSDAFAAQTGANRLAAAGDTGRGVTVAVVDTGIDQLPAFAGRLTGGVDLTGGGNPFQDGYGHGTFVAGLIAGDGAGSNGQYSGEAPGANLVSIKVAGADGLTDLGTLIQGLQWAVDHQALYQITVLNLSLGWQPTESSAIDPLDMAVAAVWHAGITVVASAGNAGPFNGTVLSPGDDPLVITVGALDDMGAATGSTAGDEMTDFSSVGPTSPDGWVKPDLVTSGRSVVSLAAPGSALVRDYPAAQIGASYFTGSGTSFSAAITSGAAALVLADNPGLSPDQVKARLLGNTDPGPVGNPFVDGHGALNAYAAATSGPMSLDQSGLVLPTLPGLPVSLSSARPLDTWNAQLWSGLNPAQQPSSGWTWDGVAWDGAAWNGWAGVAWNGWAWTGAWWDSASWSGSAWDGTAWAGSPWAGAAWGPYWDTKSWNGG